MHLTPTASRLRQKIARLRWLLPVLIMVLVFTEQYIAHVRLGHLHSWGHFFSQIVIYGLGASILSWLAMTYLVRSAEETESAQHELESTHSKLELANQRLRFLSDVSHRLSRAPDDESLVDTILDLPQEVVLTIGCSLIRFDEQGNPSVAAHRGRLTDEEFDSWVAHLTTGTAKSPCRHCLAETHSGEMMCPLVHMAELPSNRAVDCLRLSHNGRVYGQLILYRANEHGISDRQRMLLTALSSEISLALESRRLRAREMATFAYLQEARLFTDFDSRLATLLARVVEILDSEGGVLLRTDSHTSELEVQVEAGRELGAALSLVYGLALGAQGESKPLMIGDLKQEGAENAGLRSALIAPLFNEGGSLGVLVIWSGHPHRFSRHHVRLVTMLAGQLSLLLDNYRLYLQVESQAVLAERARLAREIHDGLAQVLGYLKLRLAQSELWLREGRTDRALDGLAEANRLAADAYVDTREAIDGLRLRPDDATLERWVEQVAGDFESLSGISVSSSAIPDVDLPMEVQVQLIRLVQEALSNVRKHAGADQARLEWKRMEAGLMVEIVDNGQGFDAIDVPPIAQHGLRVMRERAEMLDAEFQVTSRPGEGTRVSVLIPERWFDGGGHYATAD